jgi:hypothetical protein
MHAWLMQGKVTTCHHHPSHPHSFLTAACNQAAAARLRGPYITCQHAMQCICLCLLWARQALSLQTTQLSPLRQAAFGCVLFNLTSLLPQPGKDDHQVRPLAGSAQHPVVAQAGALALSAPTSCTLHHLLDVLVLHRVGREL